MTKKTKFVIFPIKVKNKNYRNFIHIYLNTFLDIKINFLVELKMFYWPYQSIFYIILIR